eukprot:290697-Rhodomonas_salina.3
MAKKQQKQISTLQGLFMDITVAGAGMWAVDSTIIHTTIPRFYYAGRIESDREVPGRLNFSSVCGQICIIGFLAGRNRAASGERPHRSALRSFWSAAAMLWLLD